MKRIYLDNAATTPVAREVLKAMQPYFAEKYGNASSLHLLGQEAKRALEESRTSIARSIGAKSDEIIFTSGGTEGNNLAVKGLFFTKKKEMQNKDKKPHVIITRIEHDCVLNACKWLESQGARVTFLDVNKEGFINLKELEQEITHETILVSIIHGNNEIGTIQDLGAIGKICHEKNVLFHTDACQSYTKTKINVRKQNLDLVTLNAHKIHGPKGVGALFIRRGVKITPIAHGGGQEFKLRSGTEDIPGVVGFAKAVKLAKTKYIQQMLKLRDKLIKEILQIPNTKLNGPVGNKRLCNNINISFMNIEGEALGGYLDAKGISSSTGSACSSKNLEPSHVLQAIGLPVEQANTSIRLSLGRQNTEEEIDYFLTVLPKIIKKLRKISPFG